MSRIVRIVSQPWTPTRVGDELLEALGDGYSTLTASVGFVNASGVRHLAAALEAFRTRGGHATFVVGLDGKITSEAGVRALARIADEVWLFRHPGRPLFHPKTYVFDGRDGGLALIGSANLTESALWVNYEDLAVLELAPGEDQTILDDLRGAIQYLKDGPNAHVATGDLIDKVKKQGLLPNEAESRRRQHEKEVTRDTASADEGDTPLFPPSAVAVPPAVPLLPEETDDAVRWPPAPRTGRTPVIPRAGVAHSIFVLRLGRRDSGVRPEYSPDVFIPVAARNRDRDFWGDLEPVITDDGNEYEERYAEIEFRRLSGAIEQESRRLYFYPRRDEFRLNSRQVHEDADEGDLLSIELAPPGLGFEYTARVIKPSDPLFERYDAVANEPVRNSDKRWGYA